MAHDVFISYSSKDAAPAQAICAALESAGIACWIAPRDIKSGSEWGGSIIGGIEASRAVLIVFSSNSNDSPQVVREMESAVAKRLPLIPVRVANVMPTASMQYFLGVSHWFDAYLKPIESYLPDIVSSVRQVLRGGEQPWQRFFGRLRNDRRWQMGLVAAAVIAVALITALLMRQRSIGEQMHSAMQSPLSGRWQAELADGKGGKQLCTIDIQDLGQYAFGSDCPLPLTSTVGQIVAARDGTFAPQSFRRGEDDGSFITPGGAWTYKITTSFFGFGARTLTVHQPRVPDVIWHEVPATSSIEKTNSITADNIVPAQVEWPIKDVASMLQRATDYVHAKWQADAVPMSFIATLLVQGQGGVANAQSEAGGVEIKFNYYSPSKQQGLYFLPSTIAGTIMSPSPKEDDVRRAVPSRFVDLRDAVQLLQQRGMRAKQVRQATLEWSSGPACGTGNFAIDNAILPRCGNTPRYQGVQWTIDPVFGDRSYLPATLASGSTAPAPVQNAAANATGLDSPARGAPQDTRSTDQNSTMPTPNPLANNVSSNVPDASAPGQTATTNSANLPTLGSPVSTNQPASFARVASDQPAMPPPVSNTRLPSTTYRTSKPAPPADPPGFWRRTWNDIVHHPSNPPATAKATPKPPSGSTKPQTAQPDSSQGNSTAIQQR